MAQQEPPRLVTVAEVAEVMRVSKMTVYRMIHAGDIPAIRVGKSFRVPHTVITSLINANQTQFSEQTKQNKVANQ